MANASLVVKLSAQIAEFQRSFDDAARTTQKFQEGFEASATKASAMGNIIAGGTMMAISGLKEMGQAVLDNASAVTDLSQKTGLSMRTIQEFGFVAEQTGTTVDAFANAALKLGTNLAGGSKSTVAAVTALGLSFKELQALSPDEQFNKIAEALLRVENPQERNRLALELFGARAKEILPALNEGYRSLADGAKIASDKQILALDAAGDAWARLKTNSINAATGMVGNIVLKLESMGRAFDVAALKAQLVKEQMKDVHLAAPTVPVNVDFLKALDEAKAKVAALTGEQRKQLAAAQALGTETAVLTERFGLNAAELRVLATDTKAWNSATRKSAAELKRAAEEAKRFWAELSPPQTLGISGDLGWKLPVPTLELPPDLSKYGPAIKEGITGGLPGIEIPITIPKLPAVSERMRELQNELKDIGLRGANTLAQGIAEGIETGDWGAVGQAFEDAMGQMMSEGMAAAVNFIVPGLGTALAPIFDAVSKKITGAFDFNEGRDAVQDFAKSFGGFDALHAKLGELGAAGEQLWIKLTQGVGRDNPEQAKKVIAEAQAALDAFGTEAERADKRLTALGVAVDGVNAKAALFAAPFQAFIDAQDKAGLTQDAFNAKLAAMGEKGQAEFERLGTFAGAAFAGLVKETGDAIGALEKLAPTFEVLKKGISEFGLTSTNTINELVGLYDLVHDKVTGPILQSISATGQIFAGLKDAGLLTADLFQTVATDIGASFRDLEAKGGDVAKAMALSQPVLQKLWEAQELYGEVTDETTSKLLKQAEEQGLVGDNMKDTNQKILDVLLSIAEVFGAKLPASMGKTTDAAAKTKADIEREFKAAEQTVADQFKQMSQKANVELGKIKAPTLRVPVEFDVPDMPGGSTRSVPALGGGAIVRRPTLALVGESGPEAVVPLSSLGSASVGESTVILEMDGRTLAEIAVPHIPGVVRRYVPA